METNSFILFTHAHCKYCKLAKNLLQFLINEGIIEVHDVIEDGYPSYNPATPSLYKFDKEGNIVSKLEGLHTTSVYTRFLNE